MTDLMFVAGTLAATPALYLVMLSLAAFFYRRPDGQARPDRRVDVLVPAHDEALLVASCVRSLREQSYPRALYRIVVIADNCHDETAAIASGAGADVVMVRTEPQAHGKGRALRWAMDRLTAEGAGADAMVVVDADSVADRGFLSALCAPLSGGAGAVQGESLLQPGHGASALRVAAFLLINRVRPAGRAALGLPATGLAGNGMLISTDVLRSMPWCAFSSTEDVEYGLDLQLAGIQIAYAGGAIVLSPPAPNARAAAAQQLRWEGGKLRLAKTRVPRLILAAVRCRRPSLLITALEVALPPIGLLAAATLVGLLAGAGLAGAGLVQVWALGPSALAGAGLVVHVIAGLVAADAPASAFLALLRAPLLIVTKPLSVPRIVRFRAETWVRTEREGEPTGRHPA